MRLGSFFSSSKAGALAIALCVYSLFAAGAFAQKTWNGGASGTWSTAGNWLPVGIPGASDDVILDNTNVAGSYTVTMDTVSNTCKTLKIGYSGNTNTITFKLVGTASATTIITIAGDATAADDFVVDEGGRFEFIPISTGGTTFVNTAAGNSSRIKNKGYFFYNTARSYSTPFPAPGGNGGTTYEANATLEVVAGVTNLTLSNRTWGNVIYSGTGTLSNSATTATVYQGLVTIGSGVNLQATYTAAGSITFLGDIINNGTVTLTGAGAGSIVFSGNKTLSGSPVTPLVIAGAGSASIPVGSSLTVNSAVNVNSTLNVAGTLQGGTGVIGGTGAVVVASGATLGIKHVNGINGQITAAGANSYNAGATYIFNGATTTTQLTGAALPTTVANLTTSNTASVTLSGPVTVSNQLNLAAGRLITGGNLLKAPDGASGVIRSSGYVDGTLTRALDASALGVRDFPVGTAGSYAPVSVEITSAGTGAGTLAINSTDGSHPNVVDTSHCIKRFWTLTSTGLSGFVAQLVFQYTLADSSGQGNESAYVVGSNDGLGPDWLTYATSVNTGLHTATASGVTAFSDWSVGEINALPVEVSSFTLE